MTLSTPRDRGMNPLQQIKTIEPQVRARSCPADRRSGVVNHLLLPSRHDRGKYRSLKKRIFAFRALKAPWHWTVITRVRSPSSIAFRGSSRAGP
jgi:hypothetical protein